MLNISTDRTGVSPGSWINPSENRLQKEEPKDGADTKVYDLNYPNKVKIVDDATARDNKDCTKAIKKILSNNPSFDINIAKGFFNVAKIYKIDPMMAISQSILETGWFKYQGSAVTADQHNYCGLGVTSTGIKGASFDTIEDGVRAQLQHLYAYGCKDALPSGEKVLDPRFSLVSRGIAPYW
jgi:flagellum-specific peptidoglycan hydrolase FlgJ